MAHKPADLTGTKRSHFVVTGFAGKDHRGIRMWSCLCDCGAVFQTRANRILSGEKQSCGCVGRARQSKLVSTHGMSKTPEFRAWESAKRRCRNKNDKDYHNYGGRGIEFSREWDSFESFFRDMGPRPGPGYSIDRIDVNGNYEPGNCRWATMKTQSNNRRDNILVPIDGKRVSLFAYFGQGRYQAYQRASYRIKQGWSVADAIFQPRLRNGEGWRASVA